MVGWDSVHWTLSSVLSDQHEALSDTTKPSDTVYVVNPASIQPLVQQAAKINVSTRLS